MRKFSCLRRGATSRCDLKWTILFGFLATIGLNILSPYTYASEVQHIKQLKDIGIKRAKFTQEKFNKLFLEQPELKKYISRPSTRNLLKGLGKTKGIDTVYILGIRVEFQQDADTFTTGNGLMDCDHNEFPYDSLGYPTVGYRNVYQSTWDTPFDSIRDGRGYHGLYFDPPHTKRYFEHLCEFMHNYWWDVSEHKVWIEYKVVPDEDSACYQLPHKLTYYGDPYNYMRGIFTLFRDAITLCDQQSPGIDFSKYTRESGGVIVFHAGASWQTDYFYDSPYDMPDCFISGIDGYFNTPIWVDNGTVPIVDGILYSETAFQDAMPGYLGGGLCHEMGHQLGLPDLYDTDVRTIGMGGWELMGTGNWNLNGLLPPAISAWSSEKLGFITPIELTQDSANLAIYMRCNQDTIVPKIYKVPINTDEYFLIEERFVCVSPDTTTYTFDAEDKYDMWYTDSTGVRVWKDGMLTSFMGYYDWGLPPDSGKGGLAIWHIDLDKIAQDSAMNEINVGSPKGVDMEEADGVQDFEIPWWLASDIEALFYGSPYDVFYKGNLDEFTSHTLPNTNDNSGSFTHISVYNIGEPDTIMEFSLKFDMKYANFPVQCGMFDINSPKIATRGDSLIIVSAVIDTGNIIVSGDTSFVGGVVLAHKSDGSLLWADTTRIDQYRRFGTNLFSSVGIGDIDGNGVLDIVCAPFVVWGVLNGKGNKPVVLDKDYVKSKADTFAKEEGNLCAWDVNGNRLFTKYHITDGAIFCAPLLADINLDGKDEIVLGSNDGKLRVFNGNGDTLWTKDLYEWIWGTPVWDSVSHTIYATALDGKLWAISPNGDTLWTEIEAGLLPTTSSPVVGNFNQGGRVEIIVNTGGREICCVSDKDTIAWKRTLDDTSFYSSPALADIDGDSLLDIVIAAGNKIYVLNNNGANVPGFPINTGASEAIQSSPVIGDINNDGRNEIIVASPNGKLLGFTNTGNILPGFPLTVGGEIYSTPMLVDLNQDSVCEIFTGCDDGKLYGWSIGKYGILPWPSIHRLPSNNGIYENLLPIPLHSGEAFMTHNFYVYPNPIRDKGWVRYFSGDASVVDIKIINLAAEIVGECQGKIGKTNYQDVLLPDMPSGVYLCRVEVKGSNKNLVRFKKFAVVK